MTTKKNQHHLLTAIGTGNYSYTHYYLKNEQKIETKFAFLYLHKLHKYDKVHLIMTEGAKKQIQPIQKELKKLKIIQEELENKKLPPNFNIIDIPDGKSEEEIWQIFTNVVENILKTPPHTLSVDITHGFRSIPFILSLICVYLQKVKNIHIDNIYYGAFDARTTQTPHTNPKESPPESTDTPVFQLKEAFGLIEWSYGIQTFQKFGLCQILTEKLSQILQPPSNISQKDKEKLGKMKSKLQKLKKSLQGLEQAIDLALVFETEEQANSFCQILENCSQELQQWAKPLQYVQKEMLEQIQELTSSSSNSKIDETYLKQHTKLVQWYEKKGRYAKAISLAREIFLNYALYYQGYQDKNDWKDYKEKRIKTENLFNQKNILKNSKISKRKKEILDCWQKLGYMRNQINHHGFNKNNAFAKKNGIQSIQTCLEKFYQITKYPPKTWESTLKFLEKYQEKEKFQKKNRK